MFLPPPAALSVHASPTTGSTPLPPHHLHSHHAAYHRVFTPETGIHQGSVMWSPPSSHTPAQPPSSTLSPMMAPSMGSGRPPPAHHSPSHLWKAMSTTLDDFGRPSSTMYYAPATGGGGGGGRGGGDWQMWPSVVYPYAPSSTPVMTTLPPTLSAPPSIPLSTPGIVSGLGVDVRPVPVATATSTPHSIESNRTYFLSPSAAAAAAATTAAGGAIALPPGLYWPPPSHHHPPYATIIGYPSALMSPPTMTWSPTASSTGAGAMTSGSGSRERGRSRERDRDRDRDRGRQRDRDRDKDDSSGRSPSPASSVSSDSRSSSPASPASPSMRTTTLVSEPKNASGSAPYPRHPSSLPLSSVSSSPSLPTPPTPPAPHSTHAPPSQPPFVGPSPTQAHSSMHGIPSTSTPASSTADVAMTANRLLEEMMAEYEEMAIVMRRLHDTNRIAMEANGEYENKLAHMEREFMHLYGERQRAQRDLESAIETIRRREQELFEIRAGHGGGGDRQDSRPNPDRVPLPPPGSSSMYPPPPRSPPPPPPHHPPSHPPLGPPPPRPPPPHSVMVPPSSYPSTAPRSGFPPPYSSSHYPPSPPSAYHRSSPPYSPPPSHAPHFPHSHSHPPSFYYTPQGPPTPPPPPPRPFPLPSPPGIPTHAPPPHSSPPRPSPSHPPHPSPPLYSGGIPPAATATWGAHPPSSSWWQPPTTPTAAAAMSMSGRPWSPYSAAVSAHQPPPPSPPPPSPSPPSMMAASGPSYGYPGPAMMTAPLYRGMLSYGPAASVSLISGAMGPSPGTGPGSGMGGHGYGPGIGPATGIGLGPGMMGMAGPGTRSAPPTASGMGAGVGASAMGARAASSSGNVFSKPVHRASARTTKSPIIQADGTLPEGCILAGPSGDWYQQRMSRNGAYRWVKLSKTDSDKYTGPAVDMQFIDSSGQTFRVKCLEFPR